MLPAIIQSSCLTSFPISHFKDDLGKLQVIQHQSITQHTSIRPVALFKGKCAFNAGVSAQETYDMQEDIFLGKGIYGKAFFIPST